MMNRHLTITAATMAMLGLALNGCAPKDNAKIDDAPPPVTGDMKSGVPKDVSAAPGADAAAGAPDATKLTAALKADAELTGVSVQISPKGEVALTGNVKNNDQKKKAEDLIKAAGATSVKNMILVK